jgi:methylamine dehydrogenase heavy chain
MATSTASIVRAVRAGASLLLVLCVTGALAAPPLAAEHLTVTKLGPVSPHWVFALDESLFNDIDARVDLYDADAHRWLGQIDAGYYPAFALAPDGKTTAVATTYFARGSKGARTDVVEFSDNGTLDPPAEVVIPPKRAQIPPSQYAANYSADGRLFYVTDITPAASITVVDVEKRAVLGELDTAGCVLAIPSGPNRVSSLCENGRLLTITLDGSGKEQARALSEPFFDVDKDPIFVQGAPTEDGAAFVSFLGAVHEVDLSAAAPRFKPVWWLVTPAERGTWRPGASQVLAVHKRLHRLYVPMHRGGEGTHKDGGTEIWAFDMRTHERLARWRFTKQQKLPPIEAIQVTQDDQPLLLSAATGTDPVVAKLIIMDARSGAVQHIEDNFGQSPWMLLTH